MQRITPFLWFDTQAEDAASFYVSVFKNSKILAVTRSGDSGPGPKGAALTVAFELDGLKFTALNAGPQFRFTEAVSFVVNCDTQDEVDYYWSTLREGTASEGQCGWLKDRFGLSWQVVPKVLPELLSAKDPARANRVMQALMAMRKLDIATLQRAAGV